MIYTIDYEMTSDQAMVLTTPRGFNSCKDSMRIGSLSRDESFTTPPPQLKKVRREAFDTEVTPSPCCPKWSFKAAGFRAPKSPKQWGVHEVVRSGDLPQLKSLLLEGHSCDEAVEGLRPLHFAVFGCAVEGDVWQRMTQLLLKHGARPQRVEGDSVNWASPLHLAVKKGGMLNLRVLSQLLAAGADPNEVDLHGCTALHYLCQQVMWLAAPLFISSPEASPHHGSQRVQQQAVDLLLRAGADPRMCNRLGFKASDSVRMTDPQMWEHLVKAEAWIAQRNFRIAAATAARRKVASALGNLLGQPAMVDAISSFL